MADKTYKSYEISLSTNVGVVTFLARNKAGNIIFRAVSEKKLKQAIDDALELKTHQAEELAKEKKAQEIASKKKKTLEAKIKKEKDLAKKLKEQQQPPIDRDSSGKFVSRTQAVADDSQKHQEPKKSSFWEKLKG
ncbi:hypothetical protein HZA76_00290 [Candidatus Roizmanbacteria bacterium]|nr:hypothetical protein [Candidatus Roizmanbacteria bacterium]